MAAINDSIATSTTSATYEFTSVVRSIMLSNESTGTDYITIKMGESGTVTNGEGVVLQPGQSYSWSNPEVIYARFSYKSSAGTPALAISAA